MADSLRVRLLAWYAAIVMLVVGMVGAAVCWVTWQSRLAAIDEELRSRADAVASAVRPGVGGGFDVELSSDATAYFQRPYGRPYYAVWRPDGSLLDRSDPDIARSMPAGPGVRTHDGAREVVVSTGGLTILIGRDITDVWRELRSLATTMGLVALLGVAASLAGAWWLAGRALAPVQRINETARRMASGDLTARIAVERTETELGQVASALNLAFDRLRASIERQRQFTADASHELRTPVATMMAELDWALLKERSSGDYLESLETCRRAGTRMRSLVEGLLTLARADSGELPVRRVPVDLEEIASESTIMLRPLAQQREVTLESSAVPALVYGDPDRLLELLNNLLFNAIAYNTRGGRVHVDVRRDEDQVTVRVRDTGIGIAAKDLERVFDRFYRADEARGREPGGAGLGLALAKWIVEAHGGSISCASEPGRGTTFDVRLPALTEPGREVAASRFGVRPATSQTT